VEKQNLASLYDSLQAALILIIASLIQNPKIHSIHILHDVSKDWLDGDSIFPFVFKGMIETTDLAGLKRISNEFGAQKSNGGCIGGMDGIALKIGCP
jgi:hypothetical protein